MTEKPPVGLIPRRIHDFNRMDAITDAMERYIAASMKIPDEWVVEQIELLKRYIK